MKGDQGGRKREEGRKRHFKPDAAMLPRFEEGRVEVDRRATRHIPRMRPIKTSRRTDRGRGGRSAWSICSQDMQNNPRGTTRDAVRVTIILCEISKSDVDHLYSLRSRRRVYPSARAPTRPSQEEKDGERDRVCSRSSWVHPPEPKSVARH